jgi:hypothetical protein
VIIAEIGVDMTRFPTPAHLSSWAKYAPGVKESAGRKKGNGATGHGTATWRGFWATPLSTRGAPIPSWASGTAGSRVDAARNEPLSRSADPSWSSPGTCSATTTPTFATSDPTTTTPGSTSTARSITTSANSKPSATRSPSKPPPEPQTPCNVKRSVPLDAYSDPTRDLHFRVRSRRRPTACRTMPTKKGPYRLVRHKDEVPDRAAWHEPA